MLMLALAVNVLGVFSVNISTPDWDMNISLLCVNIFSARMPATLEDRAVLMTPFE